MVSPLVGGGAFPVLRCNLRRVRLQVVESSVGAIRAYPEAGFVLATNAQASRVNRYCRNDDPP